MKQSIPQKNNFKSDFYLKPINIKAKSGLATWHQDTDVVVHDLFDGITDEPVNYSRVRIFDGKYQDCKVVKEGDKVFLLPGDTTKYSIKRINTNNKINDIVSEDGKFSCVICLEYERNHVAIPCGHVITCTRCTKSIEKEDLYRCPLCKVPYTHLQRIFK